MEPSKKKENEFLKLKKETRCQIFARGEGVPNAYKENTWKEELILEHVIQYKKEWALTYSQKREILLYPQNESGKYKFICTTVRPTKVPYPEWYNYKKCAKFISEFFEYEELSPPTEFPAYIPAPDNVVKWQIGDCFDLSIVLASLLIGAGYNAYVIYGRAPRFITSKDETKLPPPKLRDDIKIIEPTIKEEEDDNIITKDYKPKIKSEFDENELKEKAEKARQEHIKNTVIDDDMPELERNDPFKERRMHAWVMIRRNQRTETEIDEDEFEDDAEEDEKTKSEKIELTEEEKIQKEKNERKDDIFIEPSTGRLYSTKNCPYEKVDALFNNQNFYINLNIDRPIKELNWNFKKGSEWEYVMLNAGDQTDEIEDKTGQNDDETPHDQPVQPTFGLPKVKEQEKETEVLDMPPPWPNKILIPLQKYNERSPTTTQVYFYSKTKVEKFAPCSQPDGLILKIYKYHDFARFLLLKVEHRYRNRGDKLYKRIEYPFEHRSVDYYLPGQIWHWKRVEEIEATSKKVIFYPTNFETGIVYREEIFGEKIWHKYESRDDKVFERKVLLNNNSNEKQTSYRYFIDSPLYDNKILIIKFAQKTSINPLFAPEGQIYKLSYKFDKDTHIQVINHYAQGTILSKPDIFTFEDESSMTNGEKEDSSKQKDDDRENWKRSIYNNRANYIEDFKKIEDSYNRNYEQSIAFEKRIAENREVPAETNWKLYERVNGELPILEKSIFDIDSWLGDGDRDKDKNDYSGNQQSFDRIAHFLQIQKEKLDAHEPHEQIKADIIKAFKDEKTTVTNTLQKLLKDQVSTLQQRIDTFKSNENYPPQEIEKHNNEVNDIQRRINIIYQRSHQHITKIMDELKTLLEKMDDNFAKYS